MRKSRFSEEQMVTILREADRRPVAAVAKGARRERSDHLQLAEELWRLAAVDVKRLRQLEQENGRFKGVSERDFELEVLKEMARENW